MRKRTLVTGTLLAIFLAVLIWHDKLAFFCFLMWQATKFAASAVWG